MTKPKPAPSGPAFLGAAARVFVRWGAPGIRLFPTALQRWKAPGKDDPVAVPAGPRPACAILGEGLSFRDVADACAVFWNEKGGGAFAYELAKAILLRSAPLGRVTPAAPETGPHQLAAWYAGARVLLPMDYAEDRRVAVVPSKTEVERMASTFPMAWTVLLGRKTTARPACLSVAFTKDDLAALVQRNAADARELSSRVLVGWPADVREAVLKLFDGSTKADLGYLSATPLGLSLLQHFDDVLAKGGADAAPPANGPKDPSTPAARTARARAKIAEITLIVVEDEGAGDGLTSQMPAGEQSPAPPSFHDVSMSCMPEEEPTAAPSFPPNQSLPREEEAQALIFDVAEHFRGRPASSTELPATHKLERGTYAGLDAVMLTVADVFDARGKKRSPEAEVAANTEGSIDVRADTCHNDQTAGFKKRVDEETTYNAISSTQAKAILDNLKANHADVYNKLPAKMKTSPMEFAKTMTETWCRGTLVKRAKQGETLSDDQKAWNERAAAIRDASAHNYVFADTQAAAGDSIPLDVTDNYIVGFSSATLDPMFPRGAFGLIWIEGKEPSAQAFVIADKKGGSQGEFEAPIPLMYKVDARSEPLDHMNLTQSYPLSGKVLHVLVFPGSAQVASFFLDTGRPHAIVSRQMAKDPYVPLYLYLLSQMSAAPQAAGRAGG